MNHEHRKHLKTLFRLYGLRITCGCFPKVAHNIVGIRNTTRANILVPMKLVKNRLVLRCSENHCHHFWKNNFHSFTCIVCHIFLDIHKNTKYLLYHVFHNPQVSCFGGYWIEYDMQPLHIYSMMTKHGLEFLTKLG